MKESIPTTKITIKLIIFLLSIIGGILLITILNNITMLITILNLIIYLTSIILGLLTCTTIIPNIVIKKSLKNKTITTKDYKIIKRNIIIILIIIIIGVLICKTPNYIKDLNEASKELNKYLKTTPDIYQDYPSFHLLEDNLAFLKIDITFEIIRIFYIFLIGTYYLINNVKYYINPNKNIKKFYIKRIIILIVTFSIYLCLNIIPGLFHHIH